ncbi:hypothetical protein CNMCM5623_002217 [Aspergillus felis]|uniref:HAD superfamily hydrolase n=1 Tax=Aspergillus felis TaxID=1287682 RepID=A0A8H6UWL2_9EURO|nr:hypothetical protein CNMCM5623_002217 [Aspergillus felis]
MDPEKNYEDWTGIEDRKQRKKVQNRINQRAHRSRVSEKKAQDPTSGRRPFRVDRWRIAYDKPSQPSDAQQTSTNELAIRTSRRAVRLASESGHSHPRSRLAVVSAESDRSPNVQFPLPADHLLHLIHYNVYRALASNKDVLKHFTRIVIPSDAIDNLQSDRRLCGDPTIIHPLSTGLPGSLFPTRLQMVHPHSNWIDMLPFPQIRDNLIQCEGYVDVVDFLRDLFGDMVNDSLSITSGATESLPASGQMLLQGEDDDMITAGRKGLIVWGEPPDSPHFPPGTVNSDQNWLSSSTMTRIEIETTKFPAIRACIFDLDGLLINSEDKITQSTNRLLEKYGRPVFTPSIRAQLMGVPDSTNSDLFHNWAKLPIPREQFARELREEMHLQFLNCEPLPGAEKLLTNLRRARSASGDQIELALASSTKSHTFELKISRPETTQLLSYFPPERRVLGDDPRVRQGRGKPAPDIYLVALQALNSVANSDGKPILPSECLVFEDSVAGVEAGRRAGMRVVWVPHPDVAVEYQERQKEVLAGRTGMSGIGDDLQLGEIDDGWAECIPSLDHFDYEKYGIVVPS